jgi:hypothetical protein
MGKWCAVTLPDDFDEKYKSLRLKTAQEISQLWNDIGRPDLTHYGLEWYRGGSGGGWVCIDDSRTTKTFKMFVDYDQMPLHQDYYKQLACVLAYQLGMTQWIAPHP